MYNSDMNKCSTIPLPPYHEINCCHCPTKHCDTCYMEKVKLFEKQKFYATVWISHLDEHAIRFQFPFSGFYTFTLFSTLSEMKITIETREK